MELDEEIMMIMEDQLSCLKFGLVFFTNHDQLWSMY